MTRLSRLSSRIDLNSLNKRSSYLRLGDVCYFGSLDHWSDDALNTIGVKWQPWMKKEFGYTKMSNPFIQEAVEIQMTSKLADIYSSHRLKYGVEPKWIQNLPQKNRRFIRNQHLLTSEEIEPFAILASLPFSGFGYIVEEDGLTERVIKEFGLQRLSGIRQLGSLHYPTIKHDGAEMLVREFPHNRFVHSLDVRAVGKLILHNNRRVEIEHTLLDIAALTHDTLTPAGGDSIKWIDQKLFDEDAHYPELMEKVNWKKFPEAPKNSTKLLPQIILNRGVLGSVLDIADKIAYVARDLCAFYIEGPKLDGYEEIKFLLNAHRQPCSIWSSARIENDQLYFIQKERLINFLMVRATLFSKLYQNPSSRFKEMFVKTFVEKRLYGTGKLTRDQLLQMQDIHLYNMIDDEIGVPFMEQFIGLKNEKLETFQILADAEKRKHELIKKKRTVLIIEKAFAAKAGLHFKVLTKNGLQPLSEAEPEAAALIRQTIQPDYKYGLHYLDTHSDELPKALRDLHKW